MYFAVFLHSPTFAWEKWVVTVRKDNVVINNCGLQLWVKRKGLWNTASGFWSMSTCPIISMSHTSLGCQSVPNMSLFMMCSGCIICWHHNISLWFTTTVHLCDYPLHVPEVEFNQWLTDYAFCFWGMGRGWSCWFVIRDYVLDKPVRNHQEGQSRETRLSQHFWAHLQHKQHEWYTYWIHDLGQI